MWKKRRLQSWKPNSHSCQSKSHNHCGWLYSLRISFLLKIQVLTNPNGCSLQLPKKFIDIDYLTDSDLWVCNIFFNFNEITCGFLFAFVFCRRKNLEQKKHYCLFRVISLHCNLENYMLCRMHLQIIRKQITESKFTFYQKRCNIILLN